MMTQAIIIKSSFIGFVLLLLAACTPIPPRDPEFAPVKPASLMPPIQNSGSIYQSGYDMRLFEDNKAMRVGDVLTIKLDKACGYKPGQHHFLGQSG
jgi:flagellar L-ring protein FlgH